MFTWLVKNMAPVTFDGSDRTGFLTFTASFTSPLCKCGVIALLWLDRTFMNGAVRHCLAYGENEVREKSTEEKGCSHLFHKLTEQTVA